MRLLEYTRDGLIRLTEPFINDDRVPPYAILSHTWSEGQEITFNDLLNGNGKDKTGYSKVLFCARQAHRDGLDYCWVDTCCIDKSSSAELSEAINSMFRWYQKAQKCYVYLSDISKGVSTDEDEISHGWELTLSQSRWFTRGWTLQELIAPKIVEFFSKEEEFLGCKQMLAQSLHEITQIPVEVLQGQSLSDYSVLERFSWAAKRQTTRAEDESYCLFGIFDIQIPLLYGEGREKALRRLKKEIKEAAEDHFIATLQGVQSSHQRNEGRLNTIRKPINTSRSVSDSISGTSSIVRKNYSKATPPAQKNAMPSPCGKSFTSTRFLEKHIKVCNGCQNVSFKNTGSIDIHEETLDLERRLSSEFVKLDPVRIASQPEKTAVENLQSNSKALKDLKSSPNEGNSLRPTEYSPRSDNSFPTSKQDGQWSKRTPSKIGSSRAIQPGNADRDQPNSDKGDPSNTADTPLGGAEYESSPGGSPITSVDYSTISAREVHIKLLNKLEEKLPRTDVRGFIYIFFDPKRPHLHHIGRSTDTYRRKKELRYKYKSDLEILTKVSVDYPIRTESFLRLYLQDFRQRLPCVRGVVHDDWFITSGDFVIDALTKWEKFMREELPYDVETRQINPFFKYCIDKQFPLLMAKDIKMEPMRKRWDRIMVPTWFDHFCFKLDLVRNFIWKFYWPLSMTFTWTVAFIMAPHPVLFVLMGASVIGTFMCTAEELRHVRNCLMTPKKREA